VNGKDLFSTGGEIKRFVSADGAGLSYRRWYRDRPKAACLCTAGVESHGGWYGVSSAALFERGFSIYFLDRRGSGLSSGRRGDLRRAKDFYEDIKKLIDIIRAEQKGRPIFLLCISWSCKPGLAFCLKYPGAIDALILITPGFAPLVHYSLKEKTAIFFSNIFAPTALFKVPIPDAHYFTRDPGYVKFIENDELRLSKITARFCMQTFYLDRFNKRNYRSLRLPVALFLSGKDRIIDNDAVTGIFAGFASTTKRIYNYEDASHTLEFDAARGRFVHDLCQWLEDLL